MAKRKKHPTKPNALKLIMQLHEQLKQCDPLPPPWDAYQTDDPFSYHNLIRCLEERLHIPDFGPTRHIVHRGDQPQKVEFFPDHCWAIQVMPSFHNWGLFAVFESRSLIRSAFVCKGEVPHKPTADYIVVEHLCEPGAWTDHLLEEFNKGELAPTPERLRPEGELWVTLDGISYLLHIATLEVRATFRFSNPKTGPYHRLERAALRLAEQVSAYLKHPQVTTFVKMWKPYCKRK